MEIRAIEDHEVPAFREAMLATFAGDAAADPDGNERFRALVARGRAWAAFDRGNVVATAATFEQDVSVPGGATLTIAGLTMVTVRPTHRRRGLLTALLDEHLADARRRGEPCSGLWASEAAIYGRFGYGCAAEGDELTFDTRGVVLADRGGGLDEVADLSDDDAARSLPPLYERVRAARPGLIRRSEAWWTWRRFHERAELRKNLGPRRHVGAWRGDQLVGWVASRQRLDWTDGIPAGSYDIDEMVAIDARAEATLWRFVANVDLYPTVRWWNAPVDALLPWLVSDRRRLRRRRTDTLWIRPDDLDASLAARHYGDDGVLRIRVVDAGDAIHELRVDHGAARCTRVEREADLTMARATVGALLLGGVAPSLLARAGQVEGSTAALARADRMFATPIAPWCAEIF